MAQKISNLAIGSLIKFGKHQVASETAQPIIWRIADKNHSGYPANSVTLITDKIIDLRAYDATEKVGLGGDIDYKTSNINQWLNSDATAGNWYSPADSNDNPPGTEGTGYQNRPGFLFNFTSAEKLAILQTTVPYKKPSVAITNISAKVFLPSQIELTGSQTNSDGSKRLAGFEGVSAKCALTAQAYNNTLSSSKPTSASGTWSYMTRTLTDNVIYITSSGGIGYSSPNEMSMGVRPLVNISNNTKISDTADSDGCYTVLSQSAPVISGSNTDLGTKGNYYTTANGFPSTLGFTQTYSVTDADSDPVTVTEYIDNVKVRSYVATLGASNTFDVTGNTWLKLANGVHTLKVTATDGFDEVTRTYTFTKSVGLLAVQRTTPIASSTKPTHIIVTVAKNIPDGAEMKVYVCNNGFDTNIVWEEIEPGVIHTFSNSSKTSGQWGVNIRVTVDRKGKDGACYITEIGGNFK